MCPTLYHKSPGVLVTRDHKTDGLRLEHFTNHNVRVLNKTEASGWIHWDSSRGESWLLSGISDQLVDEGFIIRHEIDRIPVHVTGDESPRPEISGKYARWYRESPDLVILFNTALMQAGNPLIALGPYGSLVWEGITRSETIDEIRNRVLAIFGVDEVNQVLARLIHLGFINDIPEIANSPDEPEKFIKEFPAPYVQFHLTHSAVPWYCLWEISTSCDLRCRICNLPAFALNPPPRAQVSQIASRIIDADIFYVALLGGEPLLPDYLLEVVTYLRDNGIYVKIISNGQTLSPPLAAELAKAGLNQVEISFDGLTKETHEMSRGKGTYVTALQAINNARNAGIPHLAVVWTVHSGNLHEADQLPGFTHNAGVNECYISLFRKVGRFGATAPYSPLTSDEVAGLQVKLGELIRDNPGLNLVLLPDCTCGRTSVVVGSTGGVRTCTFTTRETGNILRTPLLKLWEIIGKRAIETEGPVGYCSELTRTPPPG